MEGILMVSICFGWAGIKPWLCSTALQVSPARSLRWIRSGRIIHHLATANPAIRDRYIVGGILFDRATAAKSSVPARPELLTASTPTPSHQQVTVVGFLHPLSRPRVMRVSSLDLQCSKQCTSNSSWLMCYISSAINLYWLVAHA